MKDFFCKHPFVSLLMLDCVVCGVVKVVAIIKGTSMENGVIRIGPSDDSE